MYIAFCVLIPAWARKTDLSLVKSSFGNDVKKEEAANIVHKVLFFKFKNITKCLLYARYCSMGLEYIGEQNKNLYPFRAYMIGVCVSYVLRDKYLQPLSECVYGL